MGAKDTRTCHTNPFVAFLLTGTNQAPEPPIEEPPQTHTSDPLQIAAQMYPWSFMTSTLDACFKNAEVAATVALSFSVSASYFDLCHMIERPRNSC